MERMVEGAVVGEQSKVIRRMSWQVQEETLPDRSRSAGSLKIQEKCFRFRVRIRLSICFRFAAFSTLTLVSYSALKN